MKGRRVLIVDDSPTILNLLKALFEEVGCEVSVAATGIDGVEKTQSESPDLVILDTVLPDIDGFEVCRRIRLSRSPEQLKIIVITGSIDAIDAVKARRMGADDYVVKTADFKLLTDAAQQLLS
ncbi:MAG: response regulator [Candidatus Omnitrophota bacterium]